MQVPSRTETDAFRVAAVLGLLAGVSVLIGILISAPYGIVAAAAGIAAGLTFELSGREDGTPALSQAAHSEHRRSATHGERHILVVASEKLSGAELRDQLRASGGADFQLEVLAPVLVSRSHRWSSDTDSERERARERLEASLAWATEQGFSASGEVGDSNPMVALEDELRDFGADEVIVTVHPSERTNWLADWMLGEISKELDIPVRQIGVSDLDKSGGPSHGK
jgi:hypothetical protein